MWMIEHLLQPAAASTRRRRSSSTTSSPGCAPRARSGSSSTSAIRACRCSTAASAPGSRAGLPVTRDAAPPPKSDWTGAPQEHTIATWRDVKDALGRAGRRHSRHAQRRRVRRHDGARQARRRDSRRRPRRMDAQPRRPTARSSPPTSCARCTKPPASRPTSEVDHVLPGRLPRRARATSRCACSATRASRNYIGIVEGMGRSRRSPDRTCPVASQAPAATRTRGLHMNNVIDFINTNRDRYVEELKEYLAIPSISALPQHAADVQRARGVDAPTRCGASGMQNVRAHRHAGHPGRLRRLARSAGRADDPLLRPLRRAAGRSASTCGSRRRSRPPCATARSTRAAPPTTRARCSCTSRPSRRT